MNNINKPLVHKIKQLGTFSGKILLGFLQSVFKEITGNYIPSAYPLSIIEPYFTSDEQGESFWSNALAINVLEIRLKDNYNIHLIFFLLLRILIALKLELLNSLMTYLTLKKST